MTGAGGPILRVEGLSGGWEGEQILRDVSLDVQRGEVLVVAGRSGCGKSTLMGYLIGLAEPWSGRVVFDGRSIWESPEVLKASRLRWGVTFQSGAMLANLSLLENVILPIREYTCLSEREMELAAYSKLELVGLSDFADSSPMEVSGGMQKRAGLARAMALDPEVLFFDEPSAGLDPVTSAQLDALILSINRSLGTTVVIVTHELASIYAISDRVVMLDTEVRGIIAEGTAAGLRDTSTDPRVLAFFRRETGADAERGG